MPLLEKENVKRYLLSMLNVGQLTMALGWLFAENQHAPGKPWGFHRNHGNPPLNNISGPANRQKYFRFCVDK